MYPYLAKSFPERPTLTTPRLNRDTACGKVFVSSYRWDVLGGGEVAEFFINNPADGPRCIIELIKPATSALAYQNMYKDVTVNDIGTELFQQNKIIDNGVASVVKTYRDGDYTYGVDEMINDELLPGGTGPRSVGSVGESIGGIVWPGHNFLIVIENATGQDTSVSVRFVWREHGPCYLC